MRRLPEFRLIPEPADAAAEAVTPNGWCDPEVGRRFKLGGAPDALQGEAAPLCDACGCAMTFYGQLDSLGDSEGLYDIADCGLILVFYGFDCCEPKAVLQSR